jgi:excinuclease ABC subunit B
VAACALAWRAGVDNRFKLVAPFTPRGDQPQAIEALAEGFQSGLRAQTLLGVTGSGKTFTMASVIEKVQRPTLVIAHNKTLAAQLCSRVPRVFSGQRGGVFRQLLRLLPARGLHRLQRHLHRKGRLINDEIDRLRHSATAALRERRDVIIVASVSCIYSMGEPSEYEGQMTCPCARACACRRSRWRCAWWKYSYERNDIALLPRAFRIRGDVVEVIPAGSREDGIRVEFFGDEIERISEFQVTTGRVIRQRAARRGVSRHPLCHQRGRHGRTISAPSRRIWTSRWLSLRAKGACWKRSASPSARATTSRCCGKSAIAPALKTIQPLF